MHAAKPEGNVKNAYPTPCAAGYAAILHPCASTRFTRQSTRQAYAPHSALWQDCITRARAREFFTFPVRTQRFDCSVILMILHTWAGRSCRSDFGLQARHRSRCTQCSPQTRPRPYPSDLISLSIHLHTTKITALSPRPRRSRRPAYTLTRSHSVTYGQQQASRGCRRGRSMWPDVCHCAAQAGRRRECVRSRGG